VGRDDVEELDVRTTARENGPELAKLLALIRRAKASSRLLGQAA
jgi:hypothetical protein